MSEGGEARLAELSRNFAWQSARVFSEHSPLYERLSASVSEDPEILALASHATSRPEPGLLLAAVHSLLLGGVEHPLAAFYPSVFGEASSLGDPYPLFRSFCLEHWGEISDLISTRRVQTNEVRRSALLLPAFCVAARKSGDRPLALVEVGTSAGLNLLFDRYGYDYGDGRLRGDARSPVRISCARRGERVPLLLAGLPRVASRTGIDLHPIDVHEPDADLWLRALIYPEKYAERADLLRRAVEIARREPPALLRGDALELLPEALAGVPVNAVPCVFHSFVVNQFSEGARERFSTMISEHGGGRDLHRVSLEWLGDDGPRLELTSFAGGAGKAEPLARCDDHGEWIEWLDADPENQGR